jgi:hypothetical protein
MRKSGKVLQRFLNTNGATSSPWYIRDEYLTHMRESMIEISEDDPELKRLENEKQEILKAIEAGETEEQELI